MRNIVYINSLNFNFKMWNHDYPIAFPLHNAITISYFLFIQWRSGLVASVSVCFAATFALLCLFICYNTDFGTFAWPLLFFFFILCNAAPATFFITPTHNKMYSNQLDMSKGDGQREWETSSWEYVINNIFYLKG